MMNITGVLRADSGTGHARRLRKTQQIPAILYRKGEAGLRLSLEHKVIFYAQENKEFLTSPIELSWENNEGKLEKQQVRIKEIQRHPFKNQILHVDFILV